MNWYTTKYPFIQVDVITKNGSIYPKEVVEKIIGQRVPVSVGFDHKKLPIGEGVVNSDITVTIELGTEFDYDKFVIVPSGTCNRRFINNNQYVIEDFKLLGMHIVQEESCWEYE